jgi:hypothetical protein
LRLLVNLPSGGRVLDYLTSSLNPIQSSTTTTTTK